MRWNAVVAGLVVAVGCSSTPPPPGDSLAVPVAVDEDEVGPTRTEAEVPESVVLTKGVRTPVVEGIEITLLGNSHKMMEQGDSPLGVSLVVHREGHDVEAHEWLELSGDPPRFVAAGVELEYVAHDYDRTLEVRVVTVDPFWKPS